MNHEQRFRVEEALNKRGQTLFIEQRNGRERFVVSNLVRIGTYDSLEYLAEVLRLFQSVDEEA